MPEVIKRGNYILWSILLQQNRSGLILFRQRDLISSVKHCDKNIDHSRIKTNPHQLNCLYIPKSEQPFHIVIGKWNAQSAIKCTTALF